MRTLTLIRAASAAAALASLAGCSAFVPTPAPPLPVATALMGGIPGALNPIDTFNFDVQPLHRFKSFYACPVKGPIKYVSDYAEDVIYVYVGKFAGQAACGQIAYQSLSLPEGIYVKTDTHDLYVANTFGSDILVFHRGETIPYNDYRDPTQQFPTGVTVAKDGTVIDINSWQPSRQEIGSISTWNEGPNGGTFVGNFSLADNGLGAFITVRKDDTVYYEDANVNTGRTTIWSLSCPAGHCHSQTRVAGLSFRNGRGIEFDAEDDLVTINAGTLTADTFELPNPRPSTFPVLTNHPYDIAINRLDHHLFIADFYDNSATEYLYPSGKFVGMVLGQYGGAMSGIAVDPGSPR